jgi:cysteine desulfurase/selenocysteine lyase
VQTLANVRQDFPILDRTVRNGKPLTYLDSAATAQRPTRVLDAVAEFERAHNGAVGRGAHMLAEEATEAFESARESVARLVGAREAREIVWTENATAAINLVASGIGNASQGIGGEASAGFRIGPGDSIVVTQAEHHANFVPWQQLAARTGATLRWIELDGDGRLILDQVNSVVDTSTKVIAFTHASNVTGIITDVAPIVARAREVGAFTFLDACQSVPHIPVDFASLGVDFAAFSGHKMLGPTGIGALWGRGELLDALPPSVFGGGAVRTVTLEETTWHPAPTRFEAGTQPVAQAVGMGVAAEYLMDIGMEAVAAHERRIGHILREGAAALPGVRLLGPVGDVNRQDVLGLAAVVVEGVHAHDVGQVLDDAGVAVRVGHHCAQPLHRHFGVASSARASSHIYTTEEDAHLFVDVLGTVRDFFGVGA